MAQPIMTISDAAAERLRALMSRADPGIVGIRVGVKSGGCSGNSYFVEYAREQQKFEEIVEEKGVRVLIDPKSMIFLLGSHMDYEEGKIQSGFVFENPNETARCGCGESVSF